jgi:hydrogenase maturation protease
MPPILVLGIGNILLRDEGVGVHVVEAMRDMPLSEDVELVDGGTAGVDLVDLLADRRKVIVVDALDAGATPGSVFRLRADELLPEPGGMVSLHQLGLLQSLSIASRLECAPKEVVVFGIQPKEISPGLTLTPEVQEVVPKAVAAVLEELRRSGSHPGEVRAAESTR